MENKRRKATWNALGILGFLLLLGLDQWTKQLAITYLQPLKNSGKVLISNTLELHYLENHGAAFGMMQNKQWIFILLSVVLLLAMILIYCQAPKTKRHLALHIILVFLAAGAVGNLVDRLQYGYVVDFIYFSLINFPIFNVADIYVTCGAAALFILLLFIYKEEDFEFLKRKVNMEVHR